MSFPFEQELRDLVSQMIDQEVDAKTIHSIVDEAIEDYNAPDEDYERYNPEDDACSEEAIEARNDLWARSQVTPEEEERENYLLEDFERQLRNAPDVQNGTDDVTVIVRKEDHPGDGWDDIPF